MDKELKKKLMDKGLSEQHAETLIGFGEQAEKLKNIKHEFGAFRARVDKDLNIVISSVSGWKVVYPPMSTSWVYLLTWMNDWENCKVIMENFVKILVFPVCNRLEGIDLEYVKAVWNAQLELDKRILENTPESSEEDVEMSEIVVSAFKDIKNEK